MLEYIINIFTVELGRRRLAIGCGVELLLDVAEFDVIPTLHLVTKVLGFCHSLEASASKHHGGVADILIYTSAQVNQCVSAMHTGINSTNGESLQIIEELDELVIVTIGKARFHVLHQAFHSCLWFTISRLWHVLVEPDKVEGNAVSVGL